MSIAVQSVDCFRGMAAPVYVSSIEMDGFRRIDYSDFASSTHVLRAGFPNLVTGLCTFSYKSEFSQITLGNIEVLEHYRRQGVSKALIGELFNFASLCGQGNEQLPQILITGFTNVARVANIPSISFWMKKFPDVPVYSI